MLDGREVVDVTFTTAQEEASQPRLGAGIRQADLEFASNQSRAQREDMGVEVRVRFEPGMRTREVHPIGVFILDLHHLEPGARCKM